MACLHNHSEIVQCLLEHGARTDIKDAWGYDSKIGGSRIESVLIFSCTALHNAAGKGLLDIVKMLVGAGADINIR